MDKYKDPNYIPPNLGSGTSGSFASEAEWERRDELKVRWSPRGFYPEEEKRVEQKLSEYRMRRDAGEAGLDDRIKELEDLIYHRR